MELEAIGPTLGRYRITGKLGEGGMGVVFRARDNQLERDLAIKLLSADLPDDSVARARLLREARAAASLNHPNICTIYEVGEAEGRVYIAMELVEGRPLSQILQSGPLSYEQVLRIGRQLADAVGLAHEHGIVHRDLKSLNVIITPDSRCKVLDFGLARRLPDERTDTTAQTMLTEDGAIAGTPAYMAPEQLRGQTADARSDVWALGVMLYEMASGVRPFAGKTSFELTSAILSQEPAPLPVKLPIGLQAVIERCLEKAPQKRYADATEIRSELDSIQQGIARVWATRVRRIRRRRVTIAVSMLALLVLGMVFAPRSLRDWIVALIAPGIESMAVLPLENRSGDPSQDYLADGITDGLIAELSQFRNLKGIIGRTSVMRYRDTDKTPAEIARELNVQILIEGSVERSQDLISVNVRAIDPSSGRTLGSVSKERPLQNFLQLQKEIISSIAQQMRLRMLPEDLERLQQIRQANPAAVDATLKGMAHWYNHTGDDIDEAEKLFQLALDKDPQYAPAYAGLMWVWTYKGSASVPPKEVISGMEKINRRMRELGVEFDETQAEAYEGKADGEFYYVWDWAKAGKDYEKAVQMKPNSVDLRLFYWDFLVAMNRMPEARAVIERALQLDPYNPFAHYSYGMYLIHAQRFDNAITQFKKMLNEKLDFNVAHGGLWTAYHHKEMYAEAYAEAKAFWEPAGVTEILEQGFKENGYKGAMHELAELLVAARQVNYVLPTNIAKFYAYAGEKEKALGYLEQAFEDKDSGLVHLQVDPDWNTLRDDPRYKSLLVKMNFPKNR